MQKILQSRFHLIDVNTLSEEDLTENVWAGTLGFIFRKQFKLMEASEYFTPVTEVALLGSKYVLPAITIDPDLTHDKVYRGYSSTSSLMLRSIGKGIKEMDALELKSRFVIVREILRRLVALICSKNATSEKWFGVYIAFAQKINQTNLLFHRHGLFNRDRKPSELSLLLCHWETNNELEKTAKHLDMRYMDTTNLSEAERKRVEDYRDLISLKALRRLVELAADMPDLPHPGVGKWLNAPADQEFPIITPCRKF